MFLVQKLSGCGLEETLAELMQRLNPLRFTVEICCLLELGALGEQLAHVLPATSRVLHHRYDLLAVRRLAKRLAGRVDAIVTLGHGGPMPWGCTAARWAGTPVVLSVLSSASSSAGGLNCWDRWATHWTDGLVAEADVQRRDLVQRQQLPAAKVHVIPRGVDTDRFCFQPAGALAVRARLKVPSGTALYGLAADSESAVVVRQLLDVARKVRMQQPAARFVLWGPGNPGSIWAQSAVDSGVSDSAHVLEDKDDLPSVLSALNGFGYVTDGPGPPLALLEAMAVQTPVVATTGEQTAALVQSESTGFLVDREDTGLLAARLLQLVNDPHLARRLGERGRQQILKHRSLDLMVRRYEQLICDTYQRKRAGPGAAQPEPLRDTIEFCGASS
jgi:glycosyltransferase involved in cell wall biosynthesis